MNQDLANYTSWSSSSSSSSSSDSDTLSVDQSGIKPAVTNLENSFKNNSKKYCDLLSELFLATQPGNEHLEFKKMSTSWWVVRKFCPSHLRCDLGCDTWSSRQHWQYMQEAHPWIHKKNDTTFPPLVNAQWMQS